MAGLRGAGGSILAKVFALALTFLGVSALAFGSALAFVLFAFAFVVVFAFALVCSAAAFSAALLVAFFFAVDFVSAVVLLGDLDAFLDFDACVTAVFFACFFAGDGVFFGDDFVLALPATDFFLAFGLAAAFDLVPALAVALVAALDLAFTLALVATLVFALTLVLAFALLGFFAAIVFRLSFSCRRFQGGMPYLPKLRPLNRNTRLRWTRRKEGA